MKQIQVTSGGVTIDLNRGITVGEALRHFIPEQAFSSDYQSDPVVSAVVGDTHVSLSQPLSYDGSFPTWASAATARASASCSGRRPST